MSTSSLPNHIRLLLFAVVLVGSGVGAYRFAVALAQPQNENKPLYEECEGLAVEFSALDLGQVWEAKDVACELPLQNVTNEDIRIVDFATSCGCVEVVPRAVTVPGRTTVHVALKLDLTHRTQGDVGKPERSFAVEVTPILRNRLRSPKPGWVVRGTVKSRITLDTSRLHFGQMPVHGQPQQARTVLATTHVPLERLDVAVDSRVASVRVTPRPGVSNQFELAIVPQASLPPGRLEAPITIDLITPEGKILRGVTLPVSGEMQPEVRPLPSRVLLGPRPVGETAEAFVVLQAPPGTDTEVAQIETDSADTHVEAVTVDGSSAGRTFRVKQRVSAAGEQTCVVRFRVKKPGQPLLTLTTEVCYYGLKGDALPGPREESK